MDNSNQQNVQKRGQHIANQLGGHNLDVPKRQPSGDRPSPRFNQAHIEKPRLGTGNGMSREGSKKTQDRSHHQANNGAIYQNQHHSQHQQMQQHYHQPQLNPEDKIRLLMKQQNHQQTHLHQQQQPTQQYAQNSDQASFLGLIHQQARGIVTNPHQKRNQRFLSTDKGASKTQASNNVNIGNDVQATLGNQVSIGLHEPGHHRQKSDNRGIGVGGVHTEQGGQIGDDREDLLAPLQQKNYYNNHESPEEDEKQDISQIIQFGKTKFSDYTRVNVIGRGTYGEVTRCIHISSGLEVAVKTFFFDNVQNGINYSTMREISLLKSLAAYPQFVKMLDVIKDDSHKDRIIHCVFEYCQSTLGKFVMKQKQSGKPFPLEKIQTMMKNLLTAIDIMHGKLILHRDIKPDNILIDFQGMLKIADFGLAKKASFMQRRKSNTIVSLWYRAPEIVLGSEDYLLGVDIWSIGCIFAEFFTLVPVFQCKSETEALFKAFKILGSPTDNHSSHLLKLNKFSQFNLPKFPVPNSLQEAFPMIENQHALDLLSKLIALDPRHRITAKEALQHDFFKPLHKKQEIMDFKARYGGQNRQQTNL